MRTAVRPLCGLLGAIFHPTPFHAVVVPFLCLFLLGTAGCIPTYDNFGGADSTQQDLPTEAYRSDGGGVDFIADSKETLDAPDTSGPTCGDWVCSVDETCHTCPGDCGECCGQGGCQEEYGESKCTCPEDCGDPCEEKKCGIDGCGGTCGDCDDGNACTKDACTPVAGCVYDPVNCDDEDDCTDDACIEGAGCTHPPGNEGGPCQNGAGTCLSGSCCVPDCVKKACGPDGCGGACGECVADLEVCVVTTQGEWTCRPEIVEIGAGAFWMGSPSGDGETCPAGYFGGGCDGSGAGTTMAEPGRANNESLHYVVLTYDFALEVHEVSQGDWVAAFEGWNPSYFFACGASCPVDQVSWYDALDDLGRDVDRFVMPLSAAYQRRSSGRASLARR